MNHRKQNTNLAKYAKNGAIIGAATFILTYQTVMHLIWNHPPKNDYERDKQQYFFEFNLVLAILDYAQMFKPYHDIGNSAIATLREFSTENYCIEGDGSIGVESNGMDLSPLGKAVLTGREYQELFGCRYLQLHPFYGPDSIFADTNPFPSLRDNPIYLIDPEAASQDELQKTWENQNRPIGTFLGLAGLAAVGAGVGASVGVTIATAQCTTRRLYQRLCVGEEKSIKDEINELQQSQLTAATNKTKTISQLKPRSFVGRFAMGTATVGAVASFASGWGILVGALWGVTVGKAAEIVSEPCRSRCKRQSP